MVGLHISHQKEHFSIAYVQALAYTAGYTVECIHVDVFGVDFEVRDRGMRIDVQMKCTADDKSDKDLIPFDLDARTYNLLTDPKRIVPAYVFLVEVPANPEQWINCVPEGLRLFKCGFYYPMPISAPTSNVATKRLHIERTSRLTVESLDRLMKEARGK